jgi:hypothetical protein
MLRKEGDGRTVSYKRDICEKILLGMLGIGIRVVDMIHLMKKGRREWTNFKVL